MSTVVVLLSDKRSGSTLVQNELCRHAAIQHVAYSPHTYFETHHWLKAAVVLGRPGVLYAGGRPYEGYGTRGNARTYLVDTLEKNIPNYKAPDNDRELVFDGWEALCRHYAKPVFFEKSPQILAQWAALSLFLEWAGRTKMDVRVIGLVRNPLAVQYSAEKLFSTKPESRQFGWLQSYRNLLVIREFLPENRFRLLRYEDITSNPSREFSKLCDFIGVSHDSSVGRTVHDGSLHRWTADMGFTLQLDQSVVQMANEFGYEKQELINNNKPAKLEMNQNNRLCMRRRILLRVSRLRDRIILPIYLRLTRK